MVVGAKLQDCGGRIHLNAAKLKKLRQQRGLSQVKLADIFQAQRLRVSLSSINRAECGQKVLYRTAFEFAEFYDLPIEHLYDPLLIAANNPLPPTDLPDASDATKWISQTLLIAIEFKHAEGMRQALNYAEHISTYHDYCENYLRFWLEMGNSVGVRLPLVSLCLIFKSMHGSDTRLLIQAIERGTQIDQTFPAISSNPIIMDYDQTDWKETRQTLQNIAWGRVVVKDNVISTIL